MWSPKRPGGSFKNGSFLSFPSGSDDFHCRTAFRLLTGETAGQAARTSTEARIQATAPDDRGMRQ